MTPSGVASIEALGLRGTLFLAALLAAQLRRIPVAPTRRSTLLVLDALRDLALIQVDRPAFRRHPVAIIHGNDRGVYGQQQAVHG